MSAAAQARTTWFERFAGSIRALMRVLRIIVRDPGLAFAVGLILLLGLIAVLGPVVWNKDPLEIDIGNILAPPSASSPMGTDDVGRDVFARFNQGARISLAVGAAVVVIAGTVGVLIGIAAGVFGRWVDAALMRMVDALLAFPALVLAMAVTVGLGIGLKTATVGIILPSIPFYARLMRSEVIQVRSAVYVEAAAALGAKRGRIIARHVFPNAMTSVPILAAANFGFAILTMAALGFVGLGAQVPTPEWGTMITEGQQYIVTGGWWVSLFPGIGVLLAVVAGSLLADRARDMVDPRRERDI
ncbi:MAG: ABC transporter permease [Actinomycetia bacterium]|nr:ABC transporter permease [Actinomycetes bacterium]